VHVDDLKRSSTSQKDLHDTAEHLREIYGEITVHLGMEHDYLGMILTYCQEDRKIILNMRKYIATCIEEFERRMALTWKRF
jgi:histidinol phosphatase-like PHP family hydrolase